MSLCILSNRKNNIKKKNDDFSQCYSVSVILAVLYCIMILCMVVNDDYEHVLFSMTKSHVTGKFNKTGFSD